MNPQALIREIDRKKLLEQSSRRRGTLSRNPYVAQGDPTLRGFAEGVVEAGLGAADAASFGALPYLSAGFTGRDVTDLVDFRDQVVKTPGGQLGGLVADFGLLGGIVSGGADVLRKTGEGITTLSRRQEKDLEAFYKFQQDPSMSRTLTQSERRGGEIDRKLEKGQVRQKSDMFTGVPWDVTKRNLDGLERIRQRREFERTGRLPYERPATIEASRVLPRFAPAEKRAYLEIERNLEQQLVPRLTTELPREVQGRTFADRSARQVSNEQVQLLLEGLNEQERAAALDGLAKRLLAAETRTRRNMPKGPDAGDWDDWVRRNTGPDRPGPVLPGSGSPEVLQDYTTPEAFANLLGGQKSLRRDRFLAKNPAEDLRGFDPSVSIAQNAVSGARQRALDLEQLSIDRASRLGRDLGDPVIGDAVLQAETQRSLDLFNQLGSPDTMAGFKMSKRLQGKSQAQRDVYERRAFDARTMLSLLRQFDDPTAAASMLEALNSDPVITNTARGFKNKRNREAWRRFVEDNE